MNERLRVLMTGFGPFDSLKLNPSWEAVKLMNKEKLESELNIQLIQQEVPVDYKYIDESVPEMWKELRPQLTIHVGVESKEGLKLEKLACKTGYQYKDSKGFVPDNESNPCDGPECISTDFDVEGICKEFNSTQMQRSDTLLSDVSEDAGKYLCEYIYYTSLCQQLNEYKSSLFIHVPLVTSEEFVKLAQGLDRVLEICIRIIRSQDMDLYKNEDPSSVETNKL